MNEIILKEQNGQVVVSSRDVAEKFEKRHDKLTSEIERMYGDLIGYAQNGGHPPIHRKFLYSPTKQTRIQRISYE